MKLFRYGAPGKEKPGYVNAAGEHFDISGLVSDFNGEFFGTDAVSELQKHIQDNAGSATKLETIERFGPPIVNASKLICVGLNYSDHALESKMGLPAEPIIFFKSTTAIVGPDDDLVIPKNSVKTDWEVELAVVIGKKASYVEEKDAHKHIAGYVLHNDYSEREFQLERGGQWVKGKSCDTFAPLGPYLVTPDEIEDENNLRLWLSVNGKMMQDGNSGNLIFKIPFLIHYISQFMTLMPGDIISTGTPAGVGLGQKPAPIFLKPGDVMRLGADGLGEQRQVCVAV